MEGWTFGGPCSHSPAAYRDATGEATLADSRWATLGHRPGNPMRLLIAATCMCLSACAGSLEQFASTGSEDKDEQTNQSKVQGGACAKLSELKILRNEFRGKI